MTKNDRLAATVILMREDREVLREIARKRGVERGRDKLDTINNLLDADQVLIQTTVSFKPVAEEQVRNLLDHNNDENYCRKHDLFDCYLCNDANIPLNPKSSSL